MTQHYLPNHQNTKQEYDYDENKHSAPMLLQCFKLLNEILTPGLCIEGEAFTQISLIEVWPCKGWLFSFPPLSEQPHFSETLSIAPSEILADPI